MAKTLSTGTASAYNPQQIFNYAGTGTGAQKKAAPFGTQVAPVALPNPSMDLSAQFPNLAQANSGVSSVINSQLMGQLSPDTINQIKDQGAAWGVSAGVPGSGLATNNALRNIGLTKFAVQNQGVQNYNSTIPTISKTQTVDPNLTADVNLQNATNAAAPNPGAAASYAQSLFQQYLDKLNPKAPVQKTSSGVPITPGMRWSEPHI
jgi:hypothetical protein